MTLDARTIIAIVVVAWVFLVLILVAFFAGADTRPRR